VQALSSVRQYAQTLFTVLFLLGAADACGADTFNPATRQLTIPSVAIGSATYADMAVIVGDIVSGPTGSSPKGTEDSYDPASRRLSIPAVMVGGKSYFNVVVTVSGLSFIGSVAGADTFDGIHLGIAAVLAAGTTYAASITVGRIVGVTGGMPVAAQDFYDPSTNELRIAAVQYGGNVYTNVIISVGSVVYASAMPSAVHRIGTRAGAPLAEFYDRKTGQSFTPRGNNYIRIAYLLDPNGIATLAHSTFSVGLYDTQHAEASLAAMQTSGYNVVRVFLEGCCQGTFGDPAGGPSAAYIANVADYLQRARTHAIYVIFTTQWLPNFGGYAANCPQYPAFSDANLRNLCPGGVVANIKFWQDFVLALIKDNAPLDAVFAYELTNEYYYHIAAAPLSWTSGTITTANGKTYDMADPGSRQNMMDDGLVYFCDQIRAGILAVDPTAIVTNGFFVPQSPNPTRLGDVRFIEVFPAMANAATDFTDLHAYPLPGDLTLAQIVQNFGFLGSASLAKKPIVMGEFGGFQSQYATATDAASGLSAWQIQSCNYAFGGWLLWTWDTDEQAGIWNALSSGGPINTSLAPVSRPNPCSL